ncbi:MAG: UvrD-helicase domain-containing protein [Syntrophorhabdales bacterium]|jgi:ATP-dependent exoDNAse (exonuclease V) beta subunit
MVRKTGPALVFPLFTVLKASAGSGKTFALSKRFAGFLLSDEVPRNRPANLLAITFSNNAAAEMKERVLDRLKRICLGNEEFIRELTKEFSEFEGISSCEIRTKAGSTIDAILALYSDFQVKTIDSFMSAVFKASAMDFGYSPDFEIVMSDKSLMKYAFDLFLRRVREGTRESAFMKSIIDTMLGDRGGDAPYPWEPAGEILNKIEGIYGKVAAYKEPVDVTDYSPNMERAKRRIEEAVEELEVLVSDSGLVKREAGSYETIKSQVKNGRFPDLIGKGMKLPPVCKPERHGNQEAYEAVLEKWRHLAGLIAEYANVYACAFYTPYLRTYQEFSGVLENAKRREGKIFIEDINKKLAEYLSDERVPDVYLRLGEVIYHYFIDEFQDTSPIQWENLRPLLDNSLSQGGSLFIVGDTKQAIYGFRNADYRIMKRVESHNDFPSAVHSVEELTKNYRSDEHIVTFTEEVFQRMVKGWEEYREAACQTGLLDYCQDVKEERTGKGYVSTCVLERNDAEPPERARLYEVLEGLLGRGYQYSDITILTSKNSDVVRITTWLNEAKIPCLSYSSLDIRKRRITGEIVALLNFLDSPLDDLAFATFILGDIFHAALKGEGRSKERARLLDLCFTHRKHAAPLYKAFQAEMGDLWSVYFDRLFRSSGYLPLYDLIAEAYAVFDVFRLFKEEEAVLAKILEVVKDLETEGGSSLRGFLRFVSASENDDGSWDVSVPHGIDAVKVMTIHKSKGLGFPVVILLLYGERSKGYPFVVRQDGGAVSLLRLTKEIAASHEELGNRYREEQMKERVNRLNSLYVAFTRAGSELYVIGVKRERETFPFSIFPDNMACCRGKAGAVQAKADEPAASKGAFHLSMPIELGSGTDDAIRFEEKKRGEMVHKIFSLVEYLDEATEGRLAEAARGIALKAGVDHEVAIDLTALAIAFLRSPLVSGYHERAPGRKVFVEQEMVASDGCLFRVDRIVMDPDKVSVIEYKTGGDREKEGEHLAQMRNYLRIAADVYPGRQIGGIIGYVDLKKVRLVSGLG